MILNVFDLKNYIYCPRILYWYYCSPVKFKETFKMQWGAKKHEEEKYKELRRTFARYGLENADMHFEIPFNNDTLSGKLDLLLINNNTYIPVEYKFTKATKSLAHKLQLYGYALLLENTYNTTIDHGYLYYPRPKQIEKIDIKPSHKKKVCDIINAINELVESEVLPDVKFSENKCYNCEFLLFCNDTV